MNGKNYKVSLPGGGFTLDLTIIADNFSVGFAEGDAPTFFDDITGLVQIEFDTKG